MRMSYEDLERLVSKRKLMIDKRDEEIEALKAERDALAAQLESFVDVLMNSENINKSTKELISGIWSCRATPQRCLRDVQAEAGRKGFIECSTRWNLCNAFGEFVLPEEIEAVADEYAATVRQGSA